MAASSWLISSLPLGGVGSDCSCGLQATCVDRIRDVDSRAACGDGLLTFRAQRAVAGNLTCTRHAGRLVGSSSAVPRRCSVHPRNRVSIGIRRLGQDGPLLTSHIAIGSVECLRKIGHLLCEIVGADDVSFCFNSSGIELVRLENLLDGVSRLRWIEYDARTKLSMGYRHCAHDERREK